MVSPRSNQLEIGAGIELIALVVLEQSTNTFANEKAVKLGKQRAKCLLCYPNSLLLELRICLEVIP